MNWGITDEVAANRSTDNFSVFELGILLHYYAHCDEHPQLGCPIWTCTISRLVELNLIRYGSASGDQSIALTERGYFYVKHGLCRVPLPERQWFIPPANAEAVKRG